jgi:hypothetical protein
MEIEIKVKRRNILREVFESYRDLPHYKQSLAEIYCAASGIAIPNKCDIPDINDSWLFREILKEIEKLKSRINELEQGNYQSNNGNDNACD